MYPGLSVYCFRSELYIGGTPNDNWDHYVKQSPLKYIKNAKTPTLIHFGENDRDLSQGQELYTDLKKLGYRQNLLFILIQDIGSLI